MLTLQLTFIPFLLSGLYELIDYVDIFKNSIGDVVVSGFNIFRFKRKVRTKNNMKAKMLFLIFEFFIAYM